jgi:hypothetical protein
VNFACQSFLKRQYICSDLDDDVTPQYPVRQPTPWKSYSLALLTLILGGVSFGEPKNACAQQACTEPQPVGFRLVRNMDPWDKPWALARTPTGTSALRIFDHGREKSPSPLPVQLDDGTRGTLSVVQRQCQKGEDCSPYDCGCIGRNESYWIEIHHRDGRLVGRKHLWAAYDRFQIVAVDLIDGPGDELLIARIHAHASPPTGWDLKIWRVAPQMTEVGGMTHLNQPLPSVTFSCAWWMARLTVDSTTSKPRTLSVNAEFGRQDCCKLIAAEKLIADLRRPHTLRFNATLQRYVIIGPAPSAFTRDQ